MTFIKLKPKFSINLVLISFLLIKQAMQLDFAQTTNDQSVAYSVYNGFIDTS